MEMCPDPRDQYTGHAGHQVERRACLQSRVASITSPPTADDRPQPQAQALSITHKSDASDGVVEGDTVSRQILCRADGVATRTRDLQSCFFLGREFTRVDENHKMYRGFNPCGSRIASLEELFHSRM